MNNRNIFDVVTGKSGASIKTIMLNHGGYQTLWNEVQEFIAADPTYDYREQERFINGFLFWSIVINNIIGLQKYKNVLVVPSFRNSRYSSLWDDNKGKIAANVAGNLWPAITEYFNTDHDVYVAYPDDHGSFARNLIRHFGVSRVSSNQPYILGDDTYQVTVPDDLKFDAVFLAGIPVNEGEQFNATDIKADFASICTEDFDLIDSYHGQSDANGKDTTYAIAFNQELPVLPPRIVGEQKDISEVAEYINNTTVHLDAEDENAGNLKFILPHLSRVLVSEFKVY